MNYIKFHSLKFTFTHLHYQYYPLIKFIYYKYTSIYETFLPRTKLFLANDKRIISRNIYYILKSNTNFS